MSEVPQWYDTTCCVERGSCDCRNVSRMMLSHGEETKRALSVLFVRMRAN